MNKQATGDRLPATGSRFLLVLLLACAHAPPRATAFGKTLALGELTGDREATALLKDALADGFELGSANPQLHLHVDATMSAYDENVIDLLNPNPSAPRPKAYRHVVRMKATLRLIEDAGGAVLAESAFEEVEKGPEQPQGAASPDDLGIILARRIVKAFAEAHHF